MEDNDDDWEDETVIPMDDEQEEAIHLDRLGGASGNHPEKQSLWGPTAPGMHQMVVVTSTRIFCCRVRLCHCRGQMEEHIQLLHFNLFPASIKRPSMAFTFDVLDHFHIDAMECKTAALNFYNKLRRLTNNTFPATTPVSVNLQTGNSLKLINI
jgi:CxC2 like cysteine cluster associated with KDZ transposases